MRELPEPDSYTWGANEPNVYTPGRVKAIQRQAYEDGLRDAVPDGYILMPTEATQEMVDAAKLVWPSGDRFKREQYRAMVTASQKEAK